MISKKTVSFLFLLLSFSLMTFAATPQQMQPFFNQNFVYQFGHDIRYKGPKDWYGVGQVNDPKTGAPFYGGIPVDVRALYTKYDPLKPPAASTFDPTVEIKIYQNTTKEKAEAFLKKYLATLEAKAASIKTENVKIKGRTWSLAQYELPAVETGRDKFYRKINVLGLPGFFFLVQLTTIEKEYAEDLKSFDQSIEETAFADEIKEKI